ncbi:MAG: hypothetical protein GC161_08630 [Planctomycetaceae bacterium]|nr:hypothetical protein [Planctomycetaceae bacterium]
MPLPQTTPPPGTAPGPSRRLGPVRGLAFGGALVVVLLGALELGLRLWLSPPHPESFEFEGAASTAPDAEGQFVRHDRRFYTLAAPFAWCADHLGLYALGPWPFRGQPAEPAPPAMARIAVLGDSCVFGVGVSAADTLPAQLQTELVRSAGIAPSQALVVGYGVPGYSTVQIRELLEREVLAHYDPVAVVLYLAAWNDNGPAMGANDIELRARARRVPRLGPLERSATVRWWKGAAASPPAADAAPTVDRAGVEASWAKGEPLYGRRVPEADLPGEVSAILDLAMAGGRPVVVVLPAHRESVLPSQPALGRDRATVERLARERGLTTIDSESLFAANDRPFDAHFVDTVHPNRVGFELLARAAAEALAAPLGQRSLPERSHGLSAEVLGKSIYSSLGDQTLRLRVRGWSAETPLPAVTVGHNPLHDLRHLGDGVFEGELARNRAGAADIVVSSAEGVVWLPSAVTLEDPAVWFERTPTPDGERWTFHFQSRPGDTARPHIAAELVALPSPDLPGSSFWLDPTTHVDPGWRWQTDSTGHTTFPVPPEWTQNLRQPLWLQAVVTPRGERVPPIANVWLEPLPLTPAREDNRGG